MSIERYENYGIVKQVGQPVLTFEIQSQVPSDETLELSSLPTSTNGTTRIDEYSVAVYGHHNNLPMELMLSVKANRLLPEILEKQRRYLYGKGPYMYIEQTEDGSVKRIPAKQEYPDIVRRVTRWLESWETLGAKDDYKAYLRKQINEFYYCENLFTLFSFNKSRLIYGDEPVRYLESIPNIHGRLASAKDLSQKDTVTISDFDGVMVGDWLRFNHRDKLLYPRLDLSNKFANGISIAIDRNDSFGET
ncbi:MAG: hypothetical protein Q8M66_03655, partial [Actinomycetota bacterium]|nr:hypothetical protein [Actinomycetota bacterium]